jgi:hypothetical protein
LTAIPTSGRRWLAWSARHRPDQRNVRQRHDRCSRVPAGNAHELDALNAELRKIQARLFATEDDAELDALVAQRKAVKARIGGFAVIPDSFDYAPTGQTVAQMWNDGDDTVRRGMARAVKAAWGMTLTRHDGQWAITIGTAGSKSAGEAGGIVNLGNGLCFRR